MKLFVHRSRRRDRDGERHGGDELASTTVGGIGAIAADADGSVFYACNTSLTGNGL